MSILTISEAWAFGGDQLAQASATPELDARLLLEHVLHLTHSALIARGDEPMTAAQEQTYRALLARATKKEPIPYLTGSAPFFDIELTVNPSVLIPRPETEQLVEFALAWALGRRQLTVVDVGTGSGCIAIVLSRRLAPATLVASDISLPALQLARLNANKFAGQPIHFVQTNLLASLPGLFDLIIANLPYVAEHEWTIMDDAVKWHEPPIALFAGVDGLGLIRDLLHEATVRLRPGGAIFLEMGWQQGSALRQLASDLFPLADVKVIPDHAGHNRILRILADAAV